MSEYYTFLKNSYERKCMQSDIKLKSILENHPKYQFPKPTISKSKASTLKYQDAFDLKLKSHVANLMEQAKKEH